MLWWMIVLALSIGALLLTGPKRLGHGGRQLARALRQGLTPLLGAAIGLALLLLAARRYVEVRDYAVMVMLGTFIYVSFVLLCLAFPERVDQGVRRLMNIRPGWIALAFAILAGLAGRFLLGDMPHVSDEVAYQFQARAIATGRLAMPAPSLPDAFNFTHLMIDNGKWYGIMNPGWPALLALGEVLRVPWIVNPIIGALVLLVFAAFFREAGLERGERQLAILLMATSPLLLFMSGTYMSHPANLLLFGVFCWAWVRMLNRESLGGAAIAGLALGANLLVRPVDTVVVTLPFLVQLLWHLRSRRRLIPHMAVVGLLGVAGIVATAGYNKALTGNPREMPVTQYFMDRNPNEKFGIGFGPDMGTTIHGDEWPGFTPVDGIRVTGHRLVEFLKDLYGLPLIVLAGVLVALRSSWRPWGEWRLVLIASGLALVAVYFLHFYHGIAYGSRHYYLAIPAIALVLGRLAAQGLAAPEPPTRGLAGAAIVSLMAATLLFAVPPLIREYGQGYRGVSRAVTRAVSQARIRHAIIFVEPGGWSWKSAFPLNRYPLESGEIIFARDLAGDNGKVIAQFPNRSIYYLAVGAADQVVIRPDSGGFGSPR